MRELILCWLYATNPGLDFIVHYGPSRTMLHMAEQAGPEDRCVRVQGEETWYYAVTARDTSIDVSPLSNIEQVGIDTRIPNTPTLRVE